MKSRAKKKQTKTRLTDLPYDSVVSLILNSFTRQRRRHFIVPTVWSYWRIPFHCFVDCKTVGKFIWQHHWLVHKHTILLITIRTRFIRRSRISTATDGNEDGDKKEKQKTKCAEYEKRTSVSLHSNTVQLLYAAAVACVLSLCAFNEIRCHDSESLMSNVFTN